MITRTLSDIIQQRFFQGKAIVILGPRQTGKTTLIKFLVEKYENETIWYNGDNREVRETFGQISFQQLKTLISDKKIIIIDEAQRINNIGLTIKQIVDNISDVQVIVSGSSSLDLTSDINEPLTGRKWEYKLFPLSFLELVNHNGFLEEKSILKHRLVYGSYPEIVSKSGYEVELLELLSDSFLLKDILSFEKIKKPVILEKLLKSIAFQVGNEVSFNELAQMTGADKETVEKYIYLLEQAFVLYRLEAFSRNLRNEIKKSRKLYFYDNGIRNAILGNFNQFDNRTDKGALWENYLVSERLKFTSYNKIYSNYYFWRTHSQQEIDFIEEKDGFINAYEFKWYPDSRHKTYKSFKEAYPDSEQKMVTSGNYYNFLGFNF